MSVSEMNTWIRDLRSRAAIYRERKPHTKTGQLVAIWSDIETAQHNGQRPAQIRDWLAELGIVMTADTLRSLLRRIRKRREREVERFSSIPTVAAAKPATVPEVPPPKLNPAEEPFDPLKQGQRILARQRFDVRKIHGDGDPRNKNLI